MHIDHDWSKLSGFAPAVAEGRAHPLTPYRKTMSKKQQKKRWRSTHTHTHGRSAHTRETIAHIQKPLKTSKVIFGSREFVARCVATIESMEEI